MRLTVMDDSCRADPSCLVAVVALAERRLCQDEGAETAPAGRVVELLVQPVRAEPAQRIDGAAVPLAATAGCNELRATRHKAGALVRITGPHAHTFAASSATATSVGTGSRTARRQPSEQRQHLPKRGAGSASPHEKHAPCT